MPVTTEAAWPTATPDVESSADTMDDIVIVKLDHSMAYAAPTWCTSSPAHSAGPGSRPFRREIPRSR